MPGPSSLVDADALVVSGVTSPCSFSNSSKGILGHGLLDGQVLLDLLQALAGQVGRDPDAAPVAVDLALDHLLGLAEVGRHVEMELVGELRDLGLGPAHLQVGVILADLVPDLVELLDGVLDLHQVVLVRLLVQGQLLLVLGEVALGPLELERDPAGRRRGRRR